MQFAVPFAGDPRGWGWYAMAPWAGRIKNGIVKDKNGKEIQLPTTFDPPHAIHGYGFFSSWEDIGHGKQLLEFPSPYDGASVIQHIEILDNRDLYVAAVEKWVAISSAVKVSDDDLNWLYPDQTIESVVNRWLSDGVALVVVTFGGNGLTGFTSDGKVEVGAVKVDVVDTVGAGDTVGAVLVEAIIEKGLANLNGDDLKATLARAAKAAAITCSRSGAKPPSKLEIVNA